MKFADLISREGWLSLESITDAGDNRLRAVICDAGQPMTQQVIEKPADKTVSQPAEYVAPYFELIWDRYFTFMVRDEGAAAFRRDEKYSGHGVRSFERSWLLGVTHELSNGLHELPGIRGPVRHFGIYCMDHIVDVLAYEEPSVRELEPMIIAQAPTPRSAV